MSEPLLPYTEACHEGRLIKREKRFSVLFSMKGEEHWAHTNNSGSMLGLLRPGIPVWVSEAPGKHRKLPFTLEMVNVRVVQKDENGQRKLIDEDGWVGVNTLAPNRLLRAAFEKGLLDFAQGYTEFESEAKTGDSRIDGLLTAPDLPPLWVECKNVTMVEDCVASFPDAVTKRGQKHLGEMMDLVKSGARAAFMYFVQRSDALCFAPADFVDPDYTELFYKSMEAGVEVYPYVIERSRAGLSLGSILPIKKAP